MASSASKSPADTEALRSGLRTGALAQLLFPSDPIGQAPTILDTLASVFPPQSGGFVIGPMVSLVGAADLVRDR